MYKRQGTSRAPTVTTVTTASHTTHTSARSSFSLGSGAPSPARITQEDIAYARLGGGGYPNGGMNALTSGANGVNGLDSTASLLALQREQTLLAAATNGLAAGGGAYQPPPPIGGMGAAVGADPFVARKGPSGPRRAGEGVEEEEQAVVAAEWLPGGGLQLCVTLLAAGFVIGSSGASVREITQHTGAVTNRGRSSRSPAGTTARRGSSDCRGSVNRSPRRRKLSTRRWRGTRSCARGSEGASSSSGCNGSEGSSFRISPRRGPPRRRLPRSAASRARPRPSRPPDTPDRR